jgi:hypothetical protein
LGGFGGGFGNQFGANIGIGGGMMGGGMIGGNQFGNVGFGGNNMALGGFSMGGSHASNSLTIGGDPLTGNGNRLVSLLSEIRTRGTASTESVEKLSTVEKQILACFGLINT